MAQGRTVRDLGAGADPPLHASGRSALGAGLFAMAQRVFFSAKNPRTRAGGDSIKGRVQRCLLQVGRLFDASLISVESNRDCCGRLN